MSFSGIAFSNVCKMSRSLNIPSLKHRFFSSKSSNKVSKTAKKIFSKRFEKQEIRKMSFEKYKRTNLLTYDTYNKKITSTYERLKMTVPSSIRMKEAYDLYCKSSYNSYLQSFKELINPFII